MKDCLDISIIVPFYKGEKYVEEAISSIRRIQHDKEIIIINDGTPAAESTVLKRLEQYPEIRVVNKKNGGVVSARNLGIDLAKGKYLLFVDQDDLVEPKTIDLAIDMLRESNYQMLFWTTEHIYEDGSKTHCGEVYNYFKYKKDLIRSNLLNDAIYNCKNHSIGYIGQIWAILFDRDFVVHSNLRFHKIIDIEDDFLFVFDSLILADRVQGITETGYYWRCNKKSETFRRKHVDNMYGKCCDFYAYLLNKIKEQNVDSFDTEYFDTFARQLSIIRSIENECTFYNFSIKACITLHKAIKMSENRKAFRCSYVCTDNTTRYQERLVVHRLISHKLDYLAYFYMLYRSVRIYLKLGTRIKTIAKFN